LDKQSISQARRWQQHDGWGCGDFLAVGLALEEAVASAVANGRRPSARAWWGGDNDGGQDGGRRRKHAWSFKELEFINDKPVGVFWKEVDGR
jgi:hypothetical protein